MNKEEFQKLKGRRIYQFYLDEETGKITDITDSMNYVKVIRCKDCKHHYYHDMLKQDYCEIPNMQFGEIEPNGYCHRAERKDEYVTLRHEDIHFIDEGAERAFYESLSERKEE